MTKHELELMGLKMIETGAYKGAYEISEVKPEYTSSEMVGFTFVYHPYEKDVICFTPEIFSVGLVTTIHDPASLDGLKLLNIARGFEPYDRVLYNDYKYIGCKGDALKVVEHFPQYLPIFEEEEDIPVPVSVRKAYEKYLAEAPAEVIVSNDGEVMNTNKPVTRENFKEFEDRGYIDSDSLNAHSIRNEGTGKSGEENERRRNGDVVDR